MRLRHESLMNNKPSCHLWQFVEPKSEKRIFEISRNSVVNWIFTKSVNMWFTKCDHWAWSQECYPFIVEYFQIMWFVLSFKNSYFSLWWFALICTVWPFLLWQNELKNRYNFINKHEIALQIVSKHEVKPSLTTQRKHIISSVLLWEGAVTTLASNNIPH